MNVKKIFIQEKMKMRENIKRLTLLFIAAVIWGVAFVAQSKGMDYVGGFTFNCLRSLLGGVVLIPVIFVLNSARKKRQDVGSINGDRRKKEDNGIVNGDRKNLVTGGVCCGILLCIASNLQQFGIKYTTVGKAGFITAMYIVIVPVLGIFIKKKVGKFVWIGVALAVAGLYLLCINEDFYIGKGDLLVLGCAVVFSLHILCVDYFSPLVDGVKLSCIQFFTCGILSGIPMIIFEEVSFQAIADCSVPILYAGIMSCGVAYTLQVIGQKNVNPTVASMVLSLESVVSVLAGWIILGQDMSGRELLGCVVMFGAIVLAQLPERKK